MSTRKASIKETGEELSREEWDRFDAAVAQERERRPDTEPFERDDHAQEPNAPRERPA